MPGRGRYIVCMQPGAEHPWLTGDWPRHIAALSGTGFVAAACMRSHEVIGYDCHPDIPVEVFRFPLAGASCVLELEMRGFV